MHGPLVHIKYVAWLCNIQRVVPVQIGWSLKGPTIFVYNKPYMYTFVYWGYLHTTHGEIIAQMSGK
jgi:hypothetical protein